MSPKKTEEGTTALEVQKPAGALVERKSFIPANDRTGTEDIGMNDIRLPRLCIAQGLSTQMVPDSSDFIDGLKLFDMFNDLTKEIYGRGPLKFVPILRQVHIIEFDPENRGVPLDLNVPPNDPRTLWTKNEEGKSLPPRATTYVDFVAMIVHADRVPEPIVISIKTTNKFQTRAAERLSTFIKFQDGPIYSAYKVVQSKSEKNDNGTFGVFVIDNGGRLDGPGQTDEQWEESMRLYQGAEQFHRSLKGKRIVIEREPGEDPEDFAAYAAAEEAGTVPKM